MPNILRGAKLLDLGRKSAAGLFFCTVPGGGAGAMCRGFFEFGENGLLG